ncbi:MAG TPA: tRNA (N(6)-L-threonylcarbamoyladenosine(37)-C(2))-methylthiotransferase MtaB [Candidatus Merdicola faecigallinarum]|uniref:Threonylcarbamoyladenosine tRNA methylthiotransferase MtaB n=1 Tax=Candidatus Merdicola faecigallinarum TaxID=2840862 RepID=A0A9D1M0R9_9FIRM|nr:tRNA (N(6)-L-threonylcarbamoyladenosine(37)-C(2))-methylthiotransferase MtaB [Candidatus Merdicola faecigallinarum]
MKVAFYTLGCKVNQYETNGMIQEFLKRNYEIVLFHEKADVYIINTCTVTNMSDKKSRQMIRRTKELNSESIVVAVGCYAQVAREKLEEMKEIDLILGVNEKNKIVDYIEEYLQEKKKIEKISDVMKQIEYSDFGEVEYSEKTRAVIKIQDGCDRFCSYCIIPYARGRVRSRKPENVVKEIRKIAKKNIKEVVLTGIHLASYGKDFKEEYHLIDLLEEINQIEGIERIRLGSLEPTLITEEFVKRLRKLEKICDHFHLSLQSGCDETLKRMNRKYSTEDFRIIVNRLRENYKEVALTTDIIVGFPGETEEEFKKTYEFLQDIHFYKMHVFKYSPREGTKAAIMEDQVDGNRKEIRSNKLIEMSNKNEKEDNEKYLGKKLFVLFEEKDGEYIKGHTTNYKVVKVKTEDIQIENEIKEVEIIGEDGLELIGCMKEEKE